MNDFLRSPSRELVRRLREGEAFIGENYPLGTIVHFDIEYLSLGFRAKKADYTSHPHYRRTTNWGVIAQMNDPSGTVLMRISEGCVHFERGWVERGWVEGTKFLPHHAPTLEDGKVIHTRMAESEHWTAVESFSRVLAVDLWSVGKGVRGPVQKSSLKGLLGKLVPKLG